MGYSRTTLTHRTFRFRAQPRSGCKEERSMKTFKSLGFRIVMVLSALASSALVLEAGQRWR